MPGPSRRAVQTSFKALRGSPKGSTTDLTTQSRALVAPLPGGRTGVDTWQVQRYILNGQLASPLPRPNRTFVDGTFGPDAPTPAVPVDLQPGGMIGGPSPRVFQYPVGYNLPTSPRAYEPIGFDMLRSLAHNVDALSAAVSLLKDEVAVPFRIKIKNTDKARSMGKDYLKKEREQIAAFFEEPDPYQGLMWDEWVKLLMNEVLITDALTIYPMRSLAYDGATPFGGSIKTDLMALQIVDGTTIKPLLDLRGARPYGGDVPAYQQYLYGVPRSEFRASGIAGMGTSEFDPAAANNFRAQDIIYKPYNRSANTVYGFPPVEQVVVAATTWLRREAWWQSYFTESDLPAMFLMGGDGWSVDQLERWEQALHSLLAGDPSFRWRLKAIPFGSKVEQIKPPNFDVSLDEFLLKIVAMVFRLTTSEYFGMSSKSGLGGKGFLEEQAGVQDRKAVMPYRRWIEGILTRIIAIYFHQPELAFRFDDEDLNDAKKQAEIDDIYINNGTRTRGEVRDDHAWGDLGIPEAEEPTIETRAGVIPLRMISEIEEMLLASGGAGAGGVDAGIIQPQEKPQSAAQPTQRDTAAQKRLQAEQRDELASFRKYVTSDQARDVPFIFRYVPADLGRSLNASLRGWLNDQSNPEV